MVEDAVRRGRDGVDDLVEGFVRIKLRVRVLGLWLGFHRDGMGVVLQLEQRERKGGSRRRVQIGSRVQGAYVYSEVHACWYAMLCGEGGESVEMAMHM